MSKFKVGDLVIGNEDNYYSITNKEAICRVVKIIDDKYMKIKVCKHSYENEQYFSKDTVYNVTAKYFKKYEYSNEKIEEEMAILEKRLKELKNKSKSMSYNGDILNGKIHIKNKISVDTNEKLLNTIEYLDHSEINISAEKILNEVNVKLESKNDKIKVEGTAKTHPDDIFDVKIGTELAYYRALEKFYSEKVKRIVKKIY